MAWHSYELAMKMIQINMQFENDCSNCLTQKYS